MEGAQNPRSATLQYLSLDTTGCSSEVEEEVCPPRFRRSWATSRASRAKKIKEIIALEEEKADQLEQGRQVKRQRKESIEWVGDSGPKLLSNVRHFVVPTSALA